MFGNILKTVVNIATAPVTVTAAAAKDLIDVAQGKDADALEQNIARFLEDLED
jgi:hypothetical protein